MYKPPEKLQNFIGGKLRNPQLNRYMDNTNPATGEILCKIPLSDSDDVELAVKAAVKAMDHGPWARSTYEERAELLEKIANRLEERIDELAQAESLDNGKPLSLARSADMPRVISNFRFFASAARQMQTECSVMPQALNYTSRHPVGVCALITPWNIPLHLLTWKVAPALAMGNAVVAKPSELTPITATLLAEVFEEVQAPKGCFNLIHGTGSEVGESLITHPHVRAISFTGGSKTGQRIAVAAAPFQKKLSLELGGKNPSIVFADCDFNETVKTVARAAFANQGQVCLCGSRILVEKSIAQKFTEALVEEAKNWKVGDPLAEETRVGALISPEHRKKVEGFVQLAKKEGGKILIGGGRPELPNHLDSNAFFEPTLIAGLSHRCRFVQEEVFGPVASIHEFSVKRRTARYSTIRSFTSSNP